MMSLYLLLFSLTLALFLPGTNSASPGIGSCVTGTAAVSAQVVNKTDGRPVVTGQLADVGIEIEIGGVALNASAPVEVSAGADLVVSLSADQLSYLELLIRVEIPSKAKTIPVLIPRANTEVAETCESPIVGLTNIDAEEKTLSTGIIRVNEVVDAVVDVTVIFLNSEVGSAFVYNKYDVRFIETESSVFLPPEEVTFDGGTTDSGLIDPIPDVWVNGTVVGGNNSSLASQNGERDPNSPDPGFIDPGFVDPTYASTTSGPGPSAPMPDVDSALDPGYLMDFVLDAGYVSSMGTSTDKETNSPPGADATQPLADVDPTTGLDSGYLYSAGTGAPPRPALPAPPLPSPTLSPDHPWYSNGNNAANNGRGNGRQRQMAQGPHGMMMMMMKKKGMKMKKKEKKGKKGKSEGYFYYQQDDDYTYNSPGQYAPMPASVPAPTQQARTTGFFHRPQRTAMPPIMPPTMPPRQRNGLFHRPRKYKYKKHKQKHPKRA